MQYIKYTIKKFLLATLLCTALCLSFAGCNNGEKSKYEYIEVSPPSGCSRAFPIAINNNGVVVGDLILQGGGGPPHWSRGFSIPNSSSAELTGDPCFIYRDGDYTKLYPPGWEHAVHLEGINDNDEVVGTGPDSDLGGKGFIYRDGEYTFLLREEGWTDAHAVAINNSGAVVGYFWNAYFGNPASSKDRLSLGFIYNEGKYTELLPDESAELVTPKDINDSGVVVGNINTFDNAGKMFIYSDGTYTFLSPPDGWQGAAVVGINNNGVVVGNGRDGNGVNKGFIYENGKYTELPLPKGWSDLYATAINNNGVVVGSMWKGQKGKVFVYSNGEYTFLLPKGWDELEARGINDNGVVVGHGATPYDYEAHFKWFMAIPNLAP
jgi:hypothetical protein